MALFTVESAREAGLKGVQARQANAERRKAELEAELKAGGISVDVRYELEIIEEQITHTRKVLNDKERLFCPACERFEMQPQHMAQLLKALDSLLDRRRELLGRPRLASVKPSQKPPARRTDPSPQPTPAE